MSIPKSETRKNSKKIAVEYFLEHGDWPTMSHIQEKLGRGSFSTVGSALAEAKAELLSRVNVLARFPEISPEIGELMISLYTVACQNVETKYDADRLELLTKITHLELREADLKNENNALTDLKETLGVDIERQHQLLEQHTETIQALTKHKISLEQSIEQSNQAIKALNKSLIDNESHYKRDQALQAEKFKQNLDSAEKRTMEIETRLTQRYSNENVLRIKEQQAAKQEINALNQSITEKLVKIGILETDHNALVETKKSLTVQLENITHQQNDYQKTIESLKTQYVEFKQQSNELIQTLKQTINDKLTIETNQRHEIEQLKETIQALTQLNSELILEKNSREK